MMKLITGMVGFGLIFSANLLVEAKVTVASFHPLMSDLARQVGGDRVEVLEMVKAGQDPHQHSTSGADLRRMATARVILFSGKGLEPYLRKIRGKTTKAIEFVEVGKTIPSLEVQRGGCIDANHHHGTIDPHWWHSVANMRRAVRVVEKALSKVDPAGSDHYRNRGKEYREQLMELDRWIRTEVEKVPKSQRKLVTAHSAFGYFCHDYGFQMVAVLGLTKEQGVSSRELAETIRILKKEHVRAVFPEKSTNPKTLQQISRETGAKLGAELIADGSSDNYVAMMQQNVKAIVGGLSKP